MHIFSTLGAEPWGRRILGVLELIIGLTLLFPKTQLLASFGALGLMIGAIGTHLFTSVGIVVQWDGTSDHGQLFIMACIAFILSLINIILYGKKQNLTLSQLIRKEILKRSK
jgi:putative oxidoreductase